MQTLRNILNWKLKGYCIYMHLQCINAHILIFCCRLLSSKSPYFHYVTPLTISSGVITIKMINLFYFSTIPYFQCFALSYIVLSNPLYSVWMFYLAAKTCKNLLFLCIQLVQSLSFLLLWYYVILLSVPCERSCSSTLLMLRSFSLWAGIKGDHVEK